MLARLHPGLAIGQARRCALQALGLVHSTIEVVHDMFITLDSMMSAHSPLWLRPVDEVLGQLEDNS
jgi:hypothetical protein